MRAFKKRRKISAGGLPPKSCLILSSYPELLRQADVYYPYRQESHFYYLTGFTQAWSLFILFSGGRSVLIIKDRDSKKEAWDGPLYSKSQAKALYGMDEVFYWSEWKTALKKKLKGVKILFYDRDFYKGGLTPKKEKILFDKNIRALKVVKKSAFEFLRAFRQIKSPEEIESIKKACSYSIQAHKELAQALKPGVGERVLHGVFIRSIMEQGALREAYPSIIASGPNALILHYIKNSAVCKKGELLLVDAGAEADYYASDITRVYPVAGRFSKAQKQAYQLLLRLQKRLIQKVYPGQSLKELNKFMGLGLTEILLELGILKGSLEKNFEAGSWKAFCPHSVGHLLGLDVHDVTFKKTEKAILKANMVLTIEPGLYIPVKDKKAPVALRGLGLRIEDDILVTKKGQDNLTVKMPKEIEEIEELCSSVGRSV